MGVGALRLSLVLPSSLPGFCSVPSRLGFHSLTKFLQTTRRQQNRIGVRKKVRSLAVRSLGSGPVELCTMTAALSLAAPCWETGHSRVKVRLSYMEAV